jgi:hypothetical protein
MFVRVCVFLKKIFFHYRFPSNESRGIKIPQKYTESPLNNTGEVNSSLHILPESRISMSMSRENGNGKIFFLKRRKL